MQQPGWVLVMIGIVIATVGLVWLAAPAVPWLGRLPGDIVISSEKTFASTSRWQRACC